MREFNKRLEKAEEAATQIDKVKKEQLIDELFERIDPKVWAYLERSGQKLAVISENWEHIELLLPRIEINGEICPNAINVSNFDIDEWYEIARNLESEESIS